MPRPAAHAAVLAAATALALPAGADEVWRGDWGRIAWHSDLGITAVLTAEGAPGGKMRRLYVEGLALDSAGPRTTYDGIWTAETSDAACALAVVDPLSGAPTSYWGTFRLTFVTRSFPSAWAGVWGECTDTPTHAFGAEPESSE